MLHVLRILQKSLGVLKVSLGCEVRNEQGGLELPELTECCSCSSTDTSYSSLGSMTLAGPSLLGCRGGSALPRAWAALLGAGVSEGCWLRLLQSLLGNCLENQGVLPHGFYGGVNTENGHRCAASVIDAVVHASC